MYEKTETILAKTKRLEADLHRELRRKEDEFFNHVERHRVRFSRDVEARHRNLSSSRTGTNRKPVSGTSSPCR